MKTLLLILLFGLSTNSIAQEEPGSPIRTVYQGSEVFVEERQLAEVILNGSAVTSDCYDFEGLFEDTTDLITELRSQFPEYQETNETKGTN